MDEVFCMAECVTSFAKVEGRQFTIDMSADLLFE